CTGTGNFLALACDQIVLGPEATLGDCRSIVFENINGKTLNDEGMVRDIKQQMVGIGEQQFYPPAIVRGFFEISLELVAAQERPDVNRGAENRAIIYLPKEDLKGDWEAAPLPPLKKPGQLLILNGETAVKVGFARAVLQNKNVEGVLGLYGIKPA